MKPYFSKILIAGSDFLNISYIWVLSVDIKHCNISKSKILASRSVQKFERNNVVKITSRSTPPPSHYQTAQKCNVTLDVYWLLNAVFLHFLVCYVWR